MDFYKVVKPKCLRDFVPDSDRDLQFLERIVSTQVTFPNPAKRAILLHGAYGSGKTELARLLPKLIEASRVHDFDDKAFFETFYSCSTTGGSQIAQAAMPTAVSFNKSRCHYVILDEVDNLRMDAQKNMKSFITEHDHVIYIMTTNHLDKVDAGLRSRSHLISFERPSRELWMARCQSILRGFNTPIDERFLKDLLRRSQCDARHILSDLESYILTHQEDRAA